MMDYSIVIPVYNAENTLTELVGRIIAVMAANRRSYEVILVNDASHDASWKVIEALTQVHDCVRGHNLAVNHGRVGAVIQGFKQSKGRRIILMDDDLQHRPEDIPALIGKADEGYDVVLARFTEKQHNSYKNLCSHFIRFLEHYAYDTPHNLQVTGFQLIERRIADRVIDKGNAKSYMPALYFRFAGVDKIANADATHQARRYGSSSYTASRAFTFLFTMIQHTTSKKFKIALFCVLFLSAGIILDGFYLLSVFLNLVSHTVNRVLVLEEIFLVGGSVLATLSYSLLFLKFNQI